MEDFDRSPAPEAETYRFINPVELEPIAAGELREIRGGCGAYFESGREVRTFFRRPAAFLDDPDGVGLFSPEQVGRIPYLYTADFTAAAADCRLVGFRTLLTADARFFTDEGYAEPEVLEKYLKRLALRDPFSNEATGLLPTDRADVFRFDAGGRPTSRVEGCAVVLCSDEPLSYGSFLFRVLPKVAAVRNLDLTDLTCITADHQGAYRELLVLAGLPAKSLVPHDMQSITHIDQAIVPCLRNNHGYLDPQSCELFAEMRAKYGGTRRGSKIYVSRLRLNQAGWSTRVMLNESELIECLARMDFDIITPEEMSIRDQIATFASARLVIGPSGSNMYNTMFCHPGTQVIDIQSEPQWIYSYTGMYSSLGLEYGIFVGKGDPSDSNTVHRRWTVNIGALVARIQALAAH